MPDLGISDVMRDYSDYGWWGASASAPRGLGDATNEYAAMPSMHCGWALWCGIQMWQLGGRWWRTAGVAYPATMAVIVVATGNHFVLDVVAGGLAVAVGYAVAIGLRRVLPLSARRSRVLPCAARSPVPWCRAPSTRAPGRGTTQHVTTARPPRA
jgi:hypothetical protein